MNPVRVLAIFFLFSLLFPAVSFAQLNINVPYALESELNVEVIPTYPRPNENVLISLTMYTADLNSATITWYKDGKQASSGKGLKQLSFTMGDVGKVTTIEIGVKLQSGTSFSKKNKSESGNVDLVWEADSYVPPFYKGKALHPKQGALKIVALPNFVVNGSRVAPENLVYEWSNGLTVYQSQSGYGKNVIVINGSPLGTAEDVAVIVTDPISNLASQARIPIPTVNPEVVFYENSPYYGFIFDQTLKNQVEMKEGELQIFAAPFFITQESPGNLKYSWRLNGASAPELEGSRMVVFKKPESGSGQSIINMEVENLNKILQFGSAGLTIKFNE